MAVNEETIYLRGLASYLKRGDQVEIAHKLGVSISTISYLTGCKRGASLAMALKLARHLGVTVEDLVEYRPAPQSRPSTQTRRAARSYSYSG